MDSKGPHPPNQPSHPQLAAMTVEVPPPLPRLWCSQGGGVILLLLLMLGAERVTAVACPELTTTQCNSLVCLSLSLGALTKKAPWAEESLNKLFEIFQQSWKEGSLGVRGINIFNYFFVGNKTV